MKHAYKYVTLATLAGTLSCGNPKTQQDKNDAQTEMNATASTHGIIDALKSYRSGLDNSAHISQAQFLDHDGNIVNLAGLQSKLRGNYATLSFMYSNCNGACQSTASQLSAVSEKFPGLKHVVISLSPAWDHEIDSTGHTKLETLLLENHSKLTVGAGGNTLVLYPTSAGEKKDPNGKPSFMGFHDGDEIALGIERGNVVNQTTSGDGVDKHTRMITLFGPGGVQLKQYAPIQLTYSPGSSDADKKDALTYFLEHVPTRAK